MFIWKDTLKRCNPYQQYVDAAGTQYVRVPQELYEEIPDPPRGNDEIEYTQEINEAPYVVITPKPQAMIDAAHNAKIWAQIKALEASELAPRMVRDLAKKSLAKDAADIGLTLDQVYALAVAQGDAAPEAAKGYKKFKDFDDSISALKRQLR